MLLFGVVDVKPQDINHTQSTLIEHFTRIDLLAAILIMFIENWSPGVERSQFIQIRKVAIQLAFTGMSVPVIKILKYFCPHQLTAAIENSNPIPLP